MTVSKGTVSTYFSNPPQRPRRQVLEAFAKVFDVPVSDLEEAATFTGREPFAPDPSSDRLTAPQRTAVNEIIRQLAEANEKAGDGDVEATPITQAGGKPAPKTGPTADELEELRRRQQKVDETPLEEILGYAAHAPGTESEKQRLDREAADRGEESQDEHPQ